MAVTAAQLAVAVRADPNDADVIAQMTRILSVADTAVRRFAPGAPENVRDEAIVRIVGYVYDMPTVPGPGFRVSDSALRGSGAAGWLAPYRVHRVGVDAAVSGTAAPDAGDGGRGIDRAAVSAIIASALPEAVAAWALIGNATQIPSNKLANAPSGGMGGGLSAAQRRLLEELGELETAFTTDKALGESRNIIGASNDLQNTNIAFPAAKTEREIRVTVFDVGNNNASDGTFEFDLADLLALPLASGDPQGSQTLALHFIGNSGNVYWFAHSVTHFVFGSDTIGTYRVVFTQHDVDVTPFVTGIPDNAAIDARIAAWAREGQAAPQIATWARAGNKDAIPADKLSNAPSSSGGASSSTLTPAALRDAATSTVGMLANSGGELYELLADTDQSNVIRCTAALVNFPLTTRASGNPSGSSTARTGCTGIAWKSRAQAASRLGTHENWLAVLPRTALGSSPPANLWVRVTAGGAVADVKMSRDNVKISTIDTATGWGYESAIGEPGIDLDSAVAGARVTAEWFSDAAFSTPQKVHGANRWEKWTDVADLDAIVAFAKTDTKPAAARTDIAALLNAAAADAERIDYGALKNRPHLVDAVHTIATPALAGYAVTTTVSQRTTLTGFAGDRLVTPIAEGYRGTILSQVDWQVASANAATIAIGADTHDVNEVAISDILADTGLWTASGALQVPLRIGSVPVHAPGSPRGAQEGRLDLYLARDAARNLGYYFVYQRLINTGGRGPFSIQARMRLILLPSDAAAPVGGGTLTQIPTTSITLFRAGQYYPYPRNVLQSVQMDPAKGDYFLVEWAGLGGARYPAYRAAGQSRAFGVGFTSFFSVDGIGTALAQVSTFNGSGTQGASVLGAPTALYRMNF